MMSVHISSGLVLHQMTSDHNRSELGIQDHSNEPSSSKLVPKVVPLAVKTATSRQELELLFHHHIAMPRTTGTFRVILFSIHNDEWKSFQCHHQTALRGSIKTVPKQRRAPSLKSKHCPEQPMHQRSPLVQFFWCCPLSPIVLHSLFFSHDLLDATTSLQNGPFNDKLKHST
ncbi:hypothetical protein Tco_0365747 [Tanacetum coccineum]